MIRIIGALFSFFVILFTANIKRGMGTGKLLPPGPTPAHPVVISAVPGAGASYK